MLTMILPQAESQHRWQQQTYIDIYEISYHFTWQLEQLEISPSAAAAASLTLHRQSHSLIGCCGVPGRFFLTRSSENNQSDCSSYL